MKFNELMRAFFRKMVQMCSNFVTTCTIRGTRGAKLPVDATFSGRSMVEMLGILAIIGVLSVGAISGYSKAMMKYKLNKSVENISYLMNIAYVYMYDIKPSGGSSTKDRSLIPYFIKMNLIPENMIKQGENAYVYDSFGNQIAIFNNEPWNEMGFVAYTNNANSADTQLCKQILDMAQMYYDFIVYMSINTGNGSKFYSGALNSFYTDLQKVNTLQECSDGSLHVSIMFRNSK